MSSDYEYQRAQEENLRSPKNRFLGLFCHANQVDDHWGPNWSFGCGVVLFSIIMGIWTIFDITTMSILMKRRVLGDWFVFWCVVRFFSDFVAIAAMFVAICSVLQTNHKKAIVGYYMLIASLIVNTAFLIYCLVNIFKADFWRQTTYQIIIWMLNEFVLFIFCWILFCNMVDIGRKVRTQQATNPF